MNPSVRTHWLLLTSAAFALSGCQHDKAQAAGSAADVFEVKRGRLRIAIKENAELAAAVETRVRSEMEGQNTVIYLIKEGTRVPTGERLVELDASQVIEKRANQEIQVARARASLVSAQKAEEIQEKQNQAEMLGAENALKVALMNQEKFEGTMVDGQRRMGEREQLQKDAEDNIKLAEQEKKLADDRLDWSKKLAEKQFITKNELERDALDADRKRYQVQRATNEKKLLEEYDLRIQEIEVSQKVIEARLALDRVKAQGEAKMAQAKAEVESSRAEYELAKERLENLEKQVRNAVVTAPTPGLVVYSFEGDGMRRREVIEEGATVRERQTLIILPDITRMIANLSVHEAMVDKVKVGQPALVRVDAFPDLVFPARVASVASLADSGQRQMNPTAKVYKTTVALEGENPPLRPNMAATCEIVISEHEDVLFLPVQAVQRQGAVSYAWVSTPTGPQARVLQLGEHDYSYVIIANGLADGDLVHLAPPAGAQAPEFPQPKDPVLPTRRASETGGEHVADAAEGGRPGGEGRGRGRRNNSPAMLEFRELFKQKQPELSALLEEDPRAMMTNADIRRAIDEDPELKAKWDSVTASFRGRRGGPGGGSGEGERGGERRNGERREDGERPAEDNK
jgi:multidrug resistance efflux pump